MDDKKVINEVAPANVQDLDQLDRIVEKIIQIDKDLEERVAVAEKRINELTYWINNEKQKAQEAKEFFTSLVAPFLKEKLKDAKTKSINLPSGTVGLRKQQPEIKRDNAKLLEWLKNKNKVDFIKITEEVKWAELKKTLKFENGRAITDSGEDLSDAIEVIEREDSIYFKK